MSDQLINSLSGKAGKKVPNMGSKTQHELVKLFSGFLREANAHITFEEAVKDIPSGFFGKKPDGSPYSLWQEVEHIRITQKDILEFCRGPHYQSPPWPEGYWPSKPAPPKGTAWKESIKEILNDRKEFISLLEDPAMDIFEPFPHGSGQNLAREAMLIVDHTSYHVGQIILIRRLLGIYK